MAEMRRIWGFYNYEVTLAKVYPIRIIIIKLYPFRHGSRQVLCYEFVFHDVYNASFNADAFIQS